MIRYASCVWELPMPTTFRAYQPDQPLLLPPDLQEWVRPGHLAHHVSDVVDALDLTAFYAPYEGDGRRNAPYEPSMMVKVLIYAYATGTFSSRAVARKLEEDVAFRMLAAGNFPQHRTVCEFRRRHLAEFSELFVGVVQVAREMGLARFGKLGRAASGVAAPRSHWSAWPSDRRPRTTRSAPAWSSASPYRPSPRSACHSRRIHGCGPWSQAPILGCRHRPDRRGLPASARWPSKRRRHPRLENAVGTPTGNRGSRSFLGIPRS